MAWPLRAAALTCFSAPVPVRRPTMDLGVHLLLAGRLTSTHCAVVIELLGQQCTIGLVGWTTNRSAGCGSTAAYLLQSEWTGKRIRPTVYKCTSGHSRECNLFYSCDPLVQRGIVQSRPGSSACRQLKAQHEHQSLSLIHISEPTRPY